MKILVVGGAGYVGAVADLLKENPENEIIVYDILLYENLFKKMWNSLMEILEIILF